MPGKEGKLKRDRLKAGGLLSGAAHRSGALSGALHSGADCSVSGVCVCIRARTHTHKERHEKQKNR
jgi:hypothetical protein